MPDNIHSAIYLANSDGTVKQYATSGGGSGGDNSITALAEVSPSLAGHLTGSYIRYNGTTYQVIEDISVGEPWLLTQT